MRMRKRLIAAAAAQLCFSGAPALDLNFGTGVMDPRLTYSGGVNGTYIDSTGVLRTAVVNRLRNNTMVGAVAGSPGTVPTNWTAMANPNSGIAWSVVSVGVENDIQYIDLRMQGTASGAVTNFGLFGFEASNNVVAASGQTWTTSAYLRLVGGSTSNISLNLSVSERDGAGAFLNQTLQAVSPTSAAIDTQRASVSRTFSNGSTAFAWASLLGTWSNGAVIDITIRIGLPQLEQSASASPVIRTTTAASTGGRFDYGNIRKNWIRNNSMVGAVAGTPGTLPTNWSTASTLATDSINRTVVGSGVEDGVAYVDVRFAGTAGSTRSFVAAANFESTSNVAALAGQSWTASTFYRLVGGSTANITQLSHRVLEYDSGGTLQANTATTVTPTSASLVSQRASATRTLTAATTAYVTSALMISYSAGAVIDITLRIGMPQLEQASAATAVIPTSGTAQAVADCLGVMLEKQRTNLLLWSEAFDDATWTKTRSSITQNAIAAPTGTVIADKLVEDTTATNTHAVNQAATLSASTTTALSVFAKAGERSALRLRLQDNVTGTNFVQGFFDLTGSGTARDATSGGTGSGATVSIQSVGNGWYRCILVGIPYTSGAAALAAVTLASTGTTVSYTGDGASGLYLFGAQLEAGPCVSSYIQTGASTVTRTQDRLSLTGDAFTNVYRQDRGTWVVTGDLAVVATGSTQSLARCSDGTTNNIVDLRAAGSSNFLTLATTSGGVGDGSASTAAVISANTVFTVAASMAADDLRISTGGAATVADSSATVPVGISQLDIGSAASGTGAIESGHIKRIRYFRDAASNDNLRRLSA